MNHREIEEDEIDIQKIIVHLKRNLNTIILITLLIGIIASAYAYFLKPIYSSSVSISFSDQKMSKLTAIMPDELSAFGTKESELETVKLTLMTRKFINSVIKELHIEQRYFIEEHFRKNELSNFSDLNVSLNIHDKSYKLLTDKSLHNELFEIQPIDNNKYLLKIDALEYEKIHHYGNTIEEKTFSITVTPKGKVETTSHFIQALDKNLLAEDILKNMQVSILSDNVMKVTYNDTVAQRAKKLVDAISKSFITYTLDKKTTELSKTLEFLEDQIAETKVYLQASGDKLQSYQQESELFMPMESSTTLFDTVSKREEEIQILKLQLHELSSFKSALKNNRLNTVSLLYSGINTASIQSLIEKFRADTLALNEMYLQSKNIEKALTSNRQLNELIERLSKQKMEIDELRFNFTTGHPQVVKATYELTKNEEEIKNYITTNIKRLEQSKSLSKNKILNNIVMTQDNIKQKLKVLTKDLNSKHTLLRSLPGKDLAIQELKRQFILSEKIYTFLLQKKMELKISKASTIANTQVIEDPIEALDPIKPNRKLIVAVGLILGLILGILYTAIKALMDTKIRDASTVTELTDAPLYGILPMKSNKRFFDEALRSIRTNLQFVLPREKQCTTMLLSSTVAGEGKTTVVTGLADIIAQTGKKVLVIDLDLRKPRLYQELNKSNKLGMTHYLVGDMDFKNFIQPVNNNLDFFAAGAVPPNPSELLMSEKMKSLIHELMKMYDYILFDTAPIGSVIDANMLLQYSDIVLLIVKANSAEKVYLENFNRLRKEKHIKSSGIILNQVKLQKNDGYGYGYGYGYGHDYDYGSVQNKGS
jgi:capsular exopolysaccharide synthesis family protein